MAFDKNAWDPSPSQLAAFSVAVAWIAAYLYERFVAGETDVATCLRAIFDGLTGTGTLNAALAALVQFFVGPFVLIGGVLWIDRKNLTYKRFVLALGIVGLTVFLVVGDLKFRLF